MLSLSFLSACPIHLQFLAVIWTVISSCCLSPYLLIPYLVLPFTLKNHSRPIVYKYLQLLLGCLCHFPCSEPQSKTVLTAVLESPSLSLVFMFCFFFLHVLISYINAAMILVSLDSTSLSVPPSLSIMLPRYARFISSI